MNPETRRRARLWLGTVFVLGAGLGGVTGYSLAHKSYASTQKPAVSLSEPERRAQRVADMREKIGLTPEQTAHLDTLIRNAHEEMKRIHDKSDGDICAVREKARDEMRATLTSEQKPKYEAYVKQLDEERNNKGHK